MAIGDDFTVTYNAGDYDIRADSPTAIYTVLELHRWLQDLADDETFTNINDEIDITTPTPSERSTDNIITLTNGFNIDDEASEYFYNGSITQASGATVYSGLVVVGSVNNAATILKVIQSDSFYDEQAAPFWSTVYSSTREDAGANILTRMLVKTRDNGVDIDGKRIRVQAREYLDTYAEFSVTLGLGNSTAAIFTNDDLNNDIVAGTISGWTEITNTEGFTATDVDINNDGTFEEFYSEWVVSGAPTGGDGHINDIYQWGKYITRDNTAKTLHGMNGEKFRGITHYFSYDGEGGAIALSTNDYLAWGTAIAYDTEVGGPFTVGEAIHEDTGTPVWKGRILMVDDDGATGTLIVLIESGTVTALDTFTGQSSDATAAVVGTPTAVTGGGYAAVLADNSTDDDLFIQLLSGTTPVDNTRMYYGSTDLSAGDATDYLDVFGSVSTASISPCYLGVSTGSHLIGAFGIGVGTDAGNTAAFRPSVGDQFFPLDESGPVLPADIRTFSVENLLYVGVADGAYVLVGPKDTGNDFDFDQYTTSGAHTEASGTFTINTTVPDDTPESGTFRVQDDDGIYQRVAYTGTSGATFTGCTSDGTWAVTSGNNLFISYIDKMYDEDDGDTGDALEYEAEYTSARNLFVRVRYGGSSSPLKTFESPSSFPGSISAIQTSDE